MNGGTSTKTTQGHKNDEKSLKIHASLGKIRGGHDAKDQKKKTTKRGLISMDGEPTEPALQENGAQSYQSREPSSSKTYPPQHTERVP